MITYIYIFETKTKNDNHDNVYGQSASQTQFNLCLKTKKINNAYPQNTHNYIGARNFDSFVYICM